MTDITPEKHPFHSLANGDDYLRLCNASLGYATDLKQNIGAIPIFGFAIDLMGHLNPIQWPMSLPFPPESLKGFVLKSIRENQSAIIASAICSEVTIRLGDKQASALQIELSHRNEQALKVYRGLDNIAWAVEPGIDYFKLSPR